MLRSWALPPRIQKAGWELPGLGRELRVVGRVKELVVELDGTARQFFQVCLMWMGYQTSCRLSPSGRRRWRGWTCERSR